jgi:PAS domain S-box-containing protein
MAAVRSEPRNILLLSSNSELQDLVKQSLETNYLGITSSAGEQPDVTVVQSAAPDLVLAEADLSPEGDSHVVEITRQFDDAVPVILLTDPGDRDRAVEALKKGVFDYVEKPVEPKALYCAVRRGLEHVTAMRLEQKYRKDAEKRLDEKTAEIARARDFLNGILESSTMVSIVLTSLHQTVLFWNKGAENIFGYTAEEMIGTKITRLYPQDALSQETVQYLRKMVNTKSGTVHGTMRQITKDGRRITIALAMTPMISKQGKVSGILGVGLEVSEQEARNDQLVGLMQQIREKQEQAISLLRQKGLKYKET